MIADCFPSETAHPAIPHPARCQFTSSDGRRCRMSRAQEPPVLCASHARAQAGANERGLSSQPAEPLDLAPLSGEFRTSLDVNRALGKVFLLLAQKRIPRRDAVALGYIAQLLLQTLPRVREEILSVQGYGGWQDTLKLALSEDEEDDTSEHEPDNEEVETELHLEASAESAAGDAPETRPQDEIQDQAGPEVPLGAPITVDVGSTHSSAESKASLNRARISRKSMPGHQAPPELNVNALSDTGVIDTSASCPEAGAPPEEEQDETTEPEEEAPVQWICRDPLGNTMVVQNVRVGIL